MRKKIVATTDPNLTYTYCGVSYNDVECYGGDIKITGYENGINVESSLDLSLVNKVI